MQSLARHLHAFIRDVRLTEDEWNAAIAFLTAAGHITDDRRQEFILLSDVLGASMQVIGVNNVAYQNATEATVFGPFFVENAPEISLGGDMAFGAVGEPCWVSGTVKDTGGNPIPGARNRGAGGRRGRLLRRPVRRRPHRRPRPPLLRRQRRVPLLGTHSHPYPIPHDGPVGQLLDAVGRSPMRASHLHFMVTAPGYRRLVTHIFVRGDEIGWKDAVFGVKESLIKDFVHHDAGTPAPDGRDLGAQSWSEVRFDIVLAPARADRRRDHIA